MKVFFTGFFVLLSVLRISAQTKAAVVDTVKVEEDKTSVFVLGTSYGNTTNYYGQTTAEKLPYGTVSMIYQHKSGLNASASALKLLNSGSGISQSDLSLGYDFDISKKLGASLLYTRYIFAKNSPLPQSVNPNAARAGLSYDWKWFNTGLLGDYVFGNVRDSSGNKLNDFFLTFNASKEIPLTRLFSKNDYISVKHSVQLTGGTQVIGHYEKRQSEATDNNLPLENSPLGRRGKRFRELLSDSDSETETYIESSSFNLLTTSFCLPLAYNRDHYTLEAAYQVSIPNKNSDLISNRNQSYFTLSFIYLFYKSKH